MAVSRSSPSPAEIVTEVTDLLAGLGLITVVLFPFALPALVLVVAPIAVAAVIGLLLFGVLAVPLLLMRTLLRGRERVLR